ncbi:MAG: ribose 5-phosphate isomerase B [Anaerolineales bacterium]|jgi:ribose 5-phosphate isomerase B
MRIAIGSDHAAYKLKLAIEELLDEMGYAYEDLGAHTDEHPADDYPLIGAEVAAAVVEARANLGILMCGTGIGMSIAANKVPGARAALCHDLFTAQKSREHNDANVLVLGSRVVDEELAKEIVRAWLGTAYAHGRHDGRNACLKVIEERYGHRG